MLNFCSRYASNTHSQNGEDGIIAECLRRMVVANGWCVEVGANDGRWCSNTARLLDLGFSGTMIEADPDLFRKCQETWAGNEKVECVNERVGRENINTFVHYDCVVFSTDTDGPDFQIFQAIKSPPRIAIVEIDSSIAPERFAFNEDGAAGYRAMVELGLSKDYFLLGHTGNLIFVRNHDRELFPEIVGDGLANSAEYFNRSWMK